MSRIKLMLFLAALSVGTVRADGGDATVVGGIDFGFKDLRLETGSVSGDLKSTFVTINPNIAFGYDSVYASLSYDRSINAEPRYSENSTGTAGLVTEFSREDVTFTLGYRLTPSFSVFVGYTRGANTFAISGAAVSLYVVQIDYTETGPFAGIAYSKSFGDKGTLGFSIGYAELNGELEMRTYGTSTGVFTAKGDTTGLSYALTWSGPLTGSLGYRVGLKLTEYQMEQPTQLDERYLSFFLGISNYF